jgi:hypothetical protein
LVLLMVVAVIAWRLAGRSRRTRVAPGGTAPRAGRSDARPARRAPRARPAAHDERPLPPAVPAITDRRSAELDRQIDDWQRRRADRGGSGS